MFLLVTPAAIGADGYYSNSELSSIHPKDLCLKPFDSLPAESWASIH